MKEVKVPEHPFGKGLPNPMGVQDEIDKLLTVEPRMFQREVIAAATLRAADYPLDVHRLRQLTGKTVIGIDLAKEGGDKTSVVEAIKGKNGDIFIIDEYSSMPNYKWYRNPIKWWKWRNLMKFMDKQIAKGKKDGSIWTSWDD